MNFELLYYYYQVYILVLNIINNLSIIAFTATIHNNKGFTAF